MEPVQDLLVLVAGDVARTIRANWPFLLLSVLAASVIQVYVGTDRLARWLRARPPLAVLGAVTLAAVTPFCSCGTTAVVLGALASAVPWAPVVAFMVSSPLTSPGEYVMSVGLFGASFATVYFVAAFVLGLAAGWVTHYVERAGWLRGQHRVSAPAAAGTVSNAVQAPVATPVRELVSPAGTSLVTVPATSGCGTPPPEPEKACSADECTDPAVAGDERSPRAFAAALWANTRRLAVLFLGFTALGYLLIHLIPTDLLTTFLGDDSVLAVPLAALLGIPVYLNSDGSLPLVASLMDGGLGSGAAMAFLITGAGTSVGAVSGMLLIARWRVVALVVASLVVGAVVTGYLTPLLV